MNIKKKLMSMVLVGTAMLLPLAVSAKVDRSDAALVMPATIEDQDVMKQLVMASMKPIYMNKARQTGILMLSDSPEYANKDGILYSDEVKGKVRMYFYHVNQQNGPRKVVVMAYNPAREPVTVTLDHLAYSRPSSAYYTVGKELSILYYETEPVTQSITVPADGYALIGEKLNSVAVQPDELFSGLLDMNFPSQMTVSSIIMPIHENPYKFVKLLQYLPSDDVHLRGTFHGSNRKLESIEDYSTDTGIGYVKLGDGIRDHFLVGRDALENRSAEDIGNYGVDYNLDVKTKGNGKVHLYFNTQGGAYAGVLSVRYDNKLDLIEVPKDPDQYNMGDNDAYAMQYVDTFEAGKEISIHLMPPGAANLPVRLIFVPDRIVQGVIQGVNVKRAELAKVVASMEEAKRKEAARHVQRTPAQNTAYKRKSKKRQVREEQVQVQPVQEEVQPVNEAQDSNPYEHTVDVRGI